MSQHQDYYYVKGLLDDDSAIIKDIYRQFRPLIVRIIKKKGGTQADGEDIFQEGLLTIWRLASKEDFKLTCPFLGFLKPICEYKWIDKLRKGSKLPIEGWFERLEQIPALDDGIQEKIQYERRVQLLWRHINKLSEKNKEVFMLRLRDGKTYKEIDEIMSYKAGGARLVFFRCKIRLKKQIQTLTRKETFKCSAVRSYMHSSATTAMSFLESIKQELIRINWYNIIAIANKEQSFPTNGTVIHVSNHKKTTTGKSIVNLRYNSLEPPEVYYFMLSMPY